MARTKQTAKKSTGGKRNHRAMHGAAVAAAAAKTTTLPYKVQYSSKESDWTFYYRRRGSSWSESCSNDFAKRNVPDTVHEFARCNADAALSNKDAALLGLLDAETSKHHRGRRPTDIIKVRLNPSPRNMHPEDPHSVGIFEAATMNDSAFFPIALHSLKLPNDKKQSQHHMTEKMWRVFKWPKEHPG